jgi:hypothetical protein
MLAALAMIAGVVIIGICIALIEHGRFGWTKTVIFAGGLSTRDPAN